MFTQHKKTCTSPSILNEIMYDGEKFKFYRCVYLDTVWHSHIHVHLWRSTVGARFYMPFPQWNRVTILFYRFVKNRDCIMVIMTITTSFCIVHTIHVRIKFVEGECVKCDTFLVLFYVFRLKWLPFNYHRNTWNVVRFAWFLFAYFGCRTWLLSI